MFARLVTTHMKPDLFPKATDKLAKDVIPLLKKQTGFRDELSFFDDKKDEAIAISFWNTKEDAVHYERDLYPKVRETMADMYEGTPKIRGFEVANSTWYDIHAH
jgi:heme-degrading monooxygenase HmoA